MVSTVTKHFHRLAAHWRDTLPLPILDVAFETVARRPEDTLRQVLVFLGLDWDPACGRGAARLGAMARGAQGPHSLDGWHRYGRWLESAKI